MRAGRDASILAAILLVALGAAEAPSNSLLQAPGERALSDVRRIAAIGPRPAGSQAERRVAALVSERFRRLGYVVAEQRFRLPDGGISQNVVARPRGTARVLIVAHLDGARGTVAANDNASGVGVLLELARALRGREGVVLAGLGAEERVVTGSRAHLGSLRLVRTLPRRVIRLAVALDMVGVGTRLHVRGVESRPNRSARLLLRGGGTYLRDPGHSDHAELTRGGIPAAWVQWRPDACWHEACDRPGRVRAAKLGAAYKLVADAARAALG